MALPFPILATEPKPIPLKGAWGQQPVQVGSKPPPADYVKPKVRVHRTGEQEVNYYSNLWNRVCKKPTRVTHDEMVQLLKEQGIKLDELPFLVIPDSCDWKEHFGDDLAHIQGIRNLVNMDYDQCYWHGYNDRLKLVVDIRIHNMNEPQEELKFRLWYKPDPNYVAKVIEVLEKTGCSMKEIFAQH